MNDLRPIRRWATPKPPIRTNSFGRWIGLEGVAAFAVVGMILLIWWLAGGLG